ncbi:hypothetical protein BX600DRAFT_478123 [Xylariales sp. PMI_506]|nr:hypothetical protein BX600DRAFT_478123 [Xylariales sp. PMI_506]
MASDGTTFPLGSVEGSLSASLNSTTGEQIDPVQGQNAWDADAGTSNEASSKQNRSLSQSLQMAHSGDTQARPATPANALPPANTNSAPPASAPTPAPAPAPAQPAKKVFSMRRSNVPERPSLSSVLSRTPSAPLISTTPILPPPPITAVKTIRSPEPARVSSDILSRDPGRGLNRTASPAAAAATGLQKNQTLGASTTASPSKLLSQKRKRSGSETAVPWPRIPLHKPTSTQPASQPPKSPASPRKSSTPPSAASPYTMSSKSRLQGSFSVRRSSKLRESSSALTADMARGSNDTGVTSQTTPFRTTFEGKYVIDVSSSDDEHSDVAANNVIDQEGSDDDASDTEFPDFTNAAYKAPSNNSDEDYGEDLDDKSDTEDPLASEPAPHDAPRPAGDRYTTWRRPDGSEERTHGALIPPEYQPYPSPETPWICPVRSCRALCSTLRGLGAHFNRKHRRELFNDNEDGTFSVIKRREANGNPMPAAVSTRRPLDPKEPPIREPTHLIPQSRSAPRRSDFGANPNAFSSQARDRVQSMRSSLISVPKSPMDPSDLGSIEDNNAAMVTWKLVHSYLSTTPFSPIPFKGYVRELLPLPRVRDICFNPSSMGREFFESRPQDISAMLIQLTGVAPPKPCTRCQQLKGPFSGCIVISPDAPLHVRKNVTACGNCFYKGNQTNCRDLTRWHLKTYPEVFRSGGSAAAAVTPVSESGRPTRLQEVVGRRSERSRSGQPSSETYLRQDQNLTPQTLGLSRKHAVSRTDSFLTRGDDMSDVPMEDWEIAPGRIRNESIDEIDNIAFSGAYLSHGEELKVGPDVGFHVVVIKPGSTHRFEAASNKIRVCSVAAGKVKVKMVEQDFELGPNGMFRVKPDTGCAVQNRMYGDATLHVTVLSGNFLN